MRLSLSAGRWPSMRQRGCGAKNEQILSANTYRRVRNCCGGNPEGDYTRAALKASGITFR